MVNNPTPGNRQQATLCGQGTAEASARKYHTEDLWKEFCSEKSFHLPTLAFDEVCEEYLTSVKNKSEVKINCKDSDNGKICDVASQHPSHCYFFHKDSRVQKLVCDRLPYFFPLGASNNLRHKQQNASVIDYIHEGNSKQTNRRCSVESRSSRTKKNIIKSRVENVSQDAKTWVNPKSCAGFPNSTGKRRVQAVTKSAGNWYTGSDGRRVYVNNNGQELTGQIAYRHHRKESGMGYKIQRKQLLRRKLLLRKNLLSRRNEPLVI